MVCPGEWPRLNQGPGRHHRTQVEGFKGPMSEIPEVMTREGGVPTPCTRFQHLGDSEVLLEQKRQSDTLISLALGGRSGTDLPESWYARDIVFRNQKETVFLRDLLRDTSRSDEQPLTLRTMCSSAVQVTPERPHRT